MSQLLEQYSPPGWAKQLKDIPKVKVKLVNANTPLQPWKLPGLPKDVSVSIKRDDMTGCAITGSKIRKLEFLMADALARNCKHVITIGVTQSNHCRAVAVSARRLGLIPHIIVFSDKKKTDKSSCSGNLLLHHVCGSLMYIEPRNERNFNELYIKMEKLAAFIRETHGEESYQIPLGGSNHLGMFGDLSLFDELVERDVLLNYDDLVCACGTGGTVAGLAIANFLTGSKLRVHGISISKDAKCLHSRINKLIKSCGLEVDSEDILNIIDWHKRQGYARYSQEDLDFIVNVGVSTGIILDPVYTGKAVKGLVHELNNNPDIFKGKRILYLHTGGMFGLYEENVHSHFARFGCTSTSNPSADLDDHEGTYLPV